MLGVGDGYHSLDDPSPPASYSLWLRIFPELFMAAFCGLLGIQCDRSVRLAAFGISPEGSWGKQTPLARGREKVCQLLALKLLRCLTHG